MRAIHTALLILGSVACVEGQQKLGGSLGCKSCHPSEWSTFNKNPHIRGLRSYADDAQVGVCESCHGPSAQHVAAQGDKTKIVSFSTLPPAKTLDRCLTCHSESMGRAQIRRSSHTLAQIACTSCHSIHKSETPKSLLVKEQRDTCYGCHSNVRAQFSLPFKHRVNEGFMKCTDCHNPHGAPASTWGMGARPRMAAQSANEEPCMKCHIDKRGPFAFEHAAVRIDGCGSCHVPHGSANARLLTRPAVFTVCLECHTGQGTFGRQGDGVARTPSFHNMADPRYRNCTTCHVRIHGSNGDPKFFR